jgi:hypothetical protein
MDFAPQTSPSPPRHSFTSFRGLSSRFSRM